MNPQADKLNDLLRNENPIIYSLLSQKGKEIFFPKDGILAQSNEAKLSKINATIGIALEDDGTPVGFSSISDKVKINPKDIFPYAPSFGKPELRKAWLQYFRQKNPSLSGRISTPVVTSALTHGLNIAAYLFADPGDRIILHDRYWENYSLIFENAYQAQLDTYNSFTKTGFDLVSFANKLKNSKSEKTIILLNFPNNPAGYTLSEKEAKELVTIVKREAVKGRKMVIILDDAYFGLVYEKDILKESLFSFLSDIHKNVLAVCLDGATKEQYVWGLRVGFITYGTAGFTENSCLALEAKTAGVIRGSISNASNLSQSLVFEALNSPVYPAEKKEKYHLLKSRYEKVKQVLKNRKFLDCFSPLPFNSGYFMCIKLNKGLDTEKVRKTLLSNYSVGVIALGYLLRIAYSSVPEKDIPQLFENIYKACKKQIIR